MKRRFIRLMELVTLIMTYHYLINLIICSILGLIGIIGMIVIYIKEHKNNGIK